MINCLVVEIARTPAGLPLVTERTVAGESLQIGRGPSCAIRLPDHRVSLEHAVIRRSDDSVLYVESVDDSLMRIDGHAARSTALPEHAELAIGPYRMAIGAAPSGYDLALTIELVQALPENAPTTRTPDRAVTLAGLGISKRRLGVGLAFAVLALFLVLPLAARGLARGTVQPNPGELWSPGPLTDGHQLLHGDCRTCHERAFAAVSDDACLACHKGLAMHRTADEARQLPRVRCIDCHADHGAVPGLTRRDSATCLRCHAAAQEAGVGSAVQRHARDFGEDHPPFRLTFKDGTGRLRLAEDARRNAVEEPGLKFSHKVHLAKDGVSSPDGQTVMQCIDCHKPETSGIGFAPPSMKTGCQQSHCHEMVFSEPAEGRVPHASEREVMGLLRDSYRAWLSQAPARARAACGASGTADCADELARRMAAETLFRQEGEDLDCGECHRIAAASDRAAPWKVAPVVLNRSWQPDAVFPHARHATVACTECHDKTQSTSSADVSIPGIAKCRECHGGEKAARGRIASGCGSCHRFHRGPPSAAAGMARREQP